MIRHKYAVFLLACFVGGMATAACAESLDDASIRAMYAEAANAVRDPVKTHQILENRLAPLFTAKSELTRIIDDKQPQILDETSTKSEVIDSTDKIMAMSKLETYENKVTDIKYADDHQSALVTDTTAHTGTINTPATTAQPAMTKHYEYGESCVSKIALDGTTLKMQQAACNAKLVIKP